MKYKSLILLLIILGMFFAFSAIKAQAATYYVDYASGNDNNNGTSTSTPWQRVKGMNGVTGTAAAANIQPGDTVYFKKGVTWPSAIIPWTPVSGSASGNVTYTVKSDWGTGDATFDGENVSQSNYYYANIGGNINASVSYITVDGLKFINSPIYNDSNKVRVAISMYNWNHTIVKNCKVYGGGIKVTSTYNQVLNNYIDYQNCFPTNPGGVIDMTGSGTHNNLVSGNEILNYDYAAIKSGGHDASGGTEDCAYDNIIEKNYIHDGARNTGYANNGIIFRDTNTTTIRYNIIYNKDNADVCLNSWSGSNGNKIYNNTCVGSYYGIDFSGSPAYNTPAQNNVIKNNLFYNCSANWAFSQSGTQNNIVDHNAYYNCGAARDDGTGNTIDSTTSWNVNPLFASTNFTSTNDFKLQASSPLITTNHGVVYDNYQNGTNTDYFGTTTPQGANVEIGAYEYSESGTPPPSGTGKEYYVDYVNGNDNNNGTSTTTPWQRVKGMNGVSGQALTANIQPGDTIYFKRGVTWDHNVMPWNPISGAEGNPITYTSKADWTTGTDNYAIFDQEGINLNGAGAIGKYGEGLPYAAQYFVLDSLKFKNAYVASNWQYVIEADSWSNFTIQNCYIFNGGMKTNGNNINFKNNYVDFNCIYKDPGGWTLEFQYGSNKVVSGNEIVNTRFGAIKTGGDATNRSSNSIIEKNYIHNVCPNPYNGITEATRIGIVFRDTDTTAIRYNIIDMSGVGNVNGAAGIVSWDAGYNNLIHNNTIVGNGITQGIDVGTSNNLIENNIVYNYGLSSPYLAIWGVTGNVFNNNVKYLGTANNDIETGNTVTNEYNVDPLFVNTKFTQKSDYGLQTSSQLISTYHAVSTGTVWNGSAWTTPNYQDGSNKDILGTAVPKGTNIEIGAVEYPESGGTPPPPPKTYSILDFTRLVTDWLKSITSPADVNSDGTVNSKDLGIMMSNWAK